MAGVNEAHGRIMGHAGAFTLPGEPDASVKIQAFKDAGVTIVNHPAKFGDALKRRLESRSSKPLGAAKETVGTGAQRRHMHTVARRPVPKQATPDSTVAQGQRRCLYLAEEKSFDLLREQGINASSYSGTGTRRLLAIGIDRSTRSPCIIASPIIDSPDAAKRFPFPASHAVNEQLATGRIAAHMQLGRGQQTADSLGAVLRSLAALFRDREAFYLETHVVERLGGLKVVGARFGLDDAAFRSAKRQADVYGDPRAAEVKEVKESWDIDASEVEAQAAAEGIVYIRLPGEDATIGTLVNGAGLAMNTVDALADAGGKAANFLDTGGKATAETVKKSFEAILTDPRVKVVFVNIFGGLTLGDMIARGVVMAFKDLDLRVPVVVRIRGTKEQEGQKIIAESGLPLFAFDDFEEAAAKAIELSRA